MKGIVEGRDAAELRTSIDHLGIPAFVIDVLPEGGFRLAAINARHEQLTGMRHAAVTGRGLDEVLGAPTAAVVEANYRRCVQARAAIDYQEVLDLPIGRTYWRTTLVPFFDADGRVFRLFGTALEVSDSVHAESEHRFQSALLNAYLEESPDGILVVDADHRMRTWNRRFLEIWHIPEAVMWEREGDEALRVVREQLQDPEAFESRVHALYANPDEEERCYRVRMRDGRLLERYSRGLRDDEGIYCGRIWFYRDVTERERMTEELARLAGTDPLTDTPNRRTFMEALDREYERAYRYRHPLSLLMLDLDRFKAVNDRHGHAAGDAALAAFADTIQPRLRESDVFARMGGEEFTVLLPETGLEEAEALAERLRAAVAAMEVSAPTARFRITVSIGVATLAAEDDRPEALLVRADRALYRAKAAGRDRVSVAGTAASRPSPASPIG